MGYQLCFALSATFACGITVTVARTPPISTLTCGLIANFCLFGLLLCGATGFPFLPAVGGWLVVLSAQARSWPAWFALLIGPLLGAAYVAAYLTGYERPPGHPVPSLTNAGQAAVVAGQFLSTAWGVGTAPDWPVGASATLVVAGLVFREASRRRTDPGTLGLAAVVIGTLGLAVLIGVGRSGFASDEMGLAGRYSWLSFPVLAAGYFAAIRTGGSLGRWLPVVVCLGSLAAWPFNTAAGMARGVGHDRWLTAIAQAAKTGSAPEVVAATYLKGSGQEERAVRGIPLLQRTGVSEYAADPRSRLGAVLVAAVLVAVLSALHIRKNRSRRSDPVASFRDTLADDYFRYAVAAGTARGLNWLRGGFVGTPLFVTDRRTHTTNALVSLAVDVEPAEGSGLEDVPAARIPRTVTATFVFENGSWRPAGKPLFNLGPAEVIARSGGRYVPLEPPRV
jgi:hypothetical protein